MKTTKLFLLFLISAAMSVISLSSCSKENIDEGNSDYASVEQLSKDENNLDAVMNDAFNDVENVIIDQGGQLKSGAGLPCNVTVDSVRVANDTITIYVRYHGLNCNETRLRNGNIEIRKKVGTHWGQAGATVNYTYRNYTVTRVATGRSITLNGTKTFENVNGGFIWQLGTVQTSVVHKATGSLSVTFDDGTTRTWNVARQLTYTGSQGSLLMTVDGFGTSGDYTNLVTWGTNRNGEQFYTSINQSVVHKQACGWDPVSGIKVHQIPSMEKSATITFGYNDNNEPITGDECPTRYRIDWTHGTHSGTAYLELH